MRMRPFPGLLCQHSFMEDLFAFAQFYPLFQLAFGYREINARHLLPIDKNTALGNQPPCLAIRGSESTGSQQVQDADFPIGEFFSGNFGGWHIVAVTAAGEKGSGRSLGFFRLFLAEDQRGKIKGKDFLGPG